MCDAGVRSVYVASDAGLCDEHMFVDAVDADVVVCVSVCVSCDERRVKCYVVLRFVSHYMLCDVCDVCEVCDVCDVCIACVARAASAPVSASNFCRGERCRIAIGKAR